MMTNNKYYYTTSLLIAIINIILLQLSIQSTMVTANDIDQTHANLDNNNQNESITNKQQSKESSKEEENNSKVISMIINPTSSYIRYLQLQLDDINTQLLDHTGINTQDEGAYADGNNNNRRLRHSSNEQSDKTIDEQYNDYEQLTIEREIIQHELNIVISKIVDTNSRSAAYTTLMEFVPSLHDTALYDESLHDARPTEAHDSSATNNSRHRVLKQRKVLDTDRIYHRLGRDMTVLPRETFLRDTSHHSLMCYLSWFVCRN